MTYEVPHFIEGKRLSCPQESKHPITDPASGKTIGYTLLAGVTRVNEAVEAAQRAAPQWAATPAVKRARILFRFRQLLETHHMALARLVTREHGKTLDDAKGSIARAIEVVEYHCGITSQLQGSYSLQVSSNIDCHTLRQPVGVCCGVSPFNFPIMVPVWMIIPAIACGNTFILKPSEQDPSAALRLLELLDEAGLPAGVANCLQGDKHTVEALLAHPGIHAVTAVASTPVAQSIYRTATACGKRAHTFGGAKNHAVIMPDADMASAAAALVGAAFGSAGERCMAISVIVTVGESTADTLLTEIVPLTQAMRIDSGEAPDTDMGPLISAAHRTRVISAISEGVAEGARLLVDGRGFQHPGYPEGFFIGPSIFDNVNTDMSIYQQEIFGPVLCIVRVRHFEEALAIINANPYGNGTAIFTSDGLTAQQFSHRVQVGMVGINIPVPVPVASHPFGGWKQSSFGDTNMHGQESIHFYTRRKTITTKWLPAPHRGDVFSMPVHE